MSGVYEEQARAVKAAKLAHVLRKAMRRAGISIEQVEAASIEAKRDAARLAGVNMPSDKTWEIVVRLLRERAL